eukprot:SAG31_NODE_39330_length_289_cov_0.800000_1_plen_95_part_11
MVPVDADPLTIWAGVQSTMVTIQAMTPGSQIYFTYNSGDGEELPLCNPRAELSDPLSPDSHTCGPYNSNDWESAAGLDCSTCLDDLCQQWSRGPG